MKITLYVKTFRFSAILTEPDVNYYKVNFCKFIQDLMNNSIADPEHMGNGKDAHGETFKSFKVIKVGQVINSRLINSYRNQRNNIKKKGVNLISAKTKVDSSALWMKLDKNVNEQYLFHGTKRINAFSIAREGFKIKGPGAFGAAVYFAENADKADHYVGTERPLAMILAKVALGTMEPVALRGNYGGPSEGYDSLLAVSKKKKDSVEKYKEITSRMNIYLDRFQEFVIFNPNQCYPEFIIEYERVK